MGLFSALMGNAGVVSQDELQRDYGKLLTEGEAIDLGFKLIRDTFIFTNKRLILIDKQGLTGSKTEYLSINYKQISRFSIETAGHFDLEADLKSGFRAKRFQVSPKNSINRLMFTTCKRCWHTMYLNKFTAFFF